MTALQLPTVRLTFWYGPAVAGLFAFSQTILGAPASLVGQAVAQVFTGEIARAGVDSPGLLPLYQRTSRKLFLIGLLPTLPWLSLAMRILRKRFFNLSEGIESPLQSFSQTDFRFVAEIVAGGGDVTLREANVARTRFSEFGTKFLAGDLV
jgi:hypothetical protein